MPEWMKKAHRVIGELCLASFKAANQKSDGSYYKRHRPYTVPSMAEALIECLNTEDEERAKAIFCWEL